jgi:hypothetical protein
LKEVDCQSLRFSCELDAFALQVTAPFVMLLVMIFWEEPLKNSERTDASAFHDNNISDFASPSLDWSLIDEGQSPVFERCTKQR